MKALILVGGLGTRIHSLYPGVPKALIPIHGKPFLQWQIELLAAQGWRSFVLCVGYQAQQIMRHFGDGSSCASPLFWQGGGVSIEYSTEQKPLGTAGAIKNAAPFLRETGLVLNGDTYLPADYNALVAHHQRIAGDGRVLGTLALARVADATAYGQVVVGDDGRILSFQEKALSAAARLVSAGAYVFEPALLDWIAAGEPASLEKDVFPALAAQGVLSGFCVSGRFLDMGTPEGLVELERWLAQHAAAPLRRQR